MLCPQSEPCHNVLSNIPVKSHSNQASSSAYSNQISNCSLATWFSPAVSSDSHTFLIPLNHKCSNQLTINKESVIELPRTCTVTLKVVINYSQLLLDNHKHMNNRERTSINLSGSYHGEPGTRPLAVLHLAN